MQNIMLFLKRRGLAQAIAQRLHDTPNVSVKYEYDYTGAATAVSMMPADVALIEATENKEDDILFCLSVCAMLHRERPACKLLLLCPESAPDYISKAVEAKRNGIIEDFVFYELSVDYIVSKLLSM